MGYAHEKRPIRTSGVSVASSTSALGPAQVTDDIVLAGSLGMSVSTATLGQDDSILSADGVSFLTYASSGATGGAQAVLAAPDFAGQVKLIFLDNQTTSVEAAIHTDATANTFWGTTFNTASITAASTGSPGGTPAGSVALLLVAASTSQWALMPGSTFNWDLSGSTGSTSIS